jgi:hypothetical protein
MGRNTIHHNFLNFIPYAVPGTHLVFGTGISDGDSTVKQSLKAS